MIPPLHPIADAIRQYHHFLVTSHVNPDGDAIGSMLAMGNILRALHKEVVVYNESGLPRRFDWITGGEAIVSTLPAHKPEAIIVLDCGDVRRPGETIQPWLTTLPIINLDHHLGNSHFGTYNWVDQRMAATGEMVGMLARVFGIPFAGALGEALYLALTADTGDFCYNNTRPQTLE
ncbi:MAG: DHH family phosphoesterase, partial [Desulfomicrobiaceae bacterium]